ncbi:hypothetical protein X975_20070, partial [Stegodyphus mimosarum]
MEEEADEKILLEDCPRNQERHDGARLIRNSVNLPSVIPELTVYVHLFLSEGIQMRLDLEADWILKTQKEERYFTSKIFSNLKPFMNFVGHSFRFKEYDVVKTF